MDDAAAAYPGRRHAWWMIAILFFASIVSVLDRNVLAAYGAAAWAPTMLMRGFGATRLEIGQWLGPISMFFSVLGPTIGGTLVERFEQAGHRGDRHDHAGDPAAGAAARRQRLEGTHILARS